MCCIQLKNIYLQLTVQMWIISRIFHLKIQILSEDVQSGQEQWSMKKPEVPLSKYIEIPEC
jgi:hypothetical protein